MSTTKHANEIRRLVNQKIDIVNQLRIEHKDEHQDFISGYIEIRLESIVGDIDHLILEEVERMSCTLTVPLIHKIGSLPDKYPMTHVAPSMIEICKFKETLKKRLCDHYRAFGYVVEINDMTPLMNLRISWH